MAGLNLVIDDYVGNRGKLALRKSNTANRVIEIPYAMETYQPLIDHCAQFVPTEWAEAIKDIYMQERALIQQRQQLMLSYKDSLRPILAAEILAFPSTHPEYFI